MLIPLLKFASDAQPATIPGLRPGGAPGEFELDPETFVWAGPKIRDGRLRFQARGLRRASLNVQGRAGCDRLIEAITSPHGEPQEVLCAERIWQTPNFGIRYVERPNQAACSVLLLVDGAFPPREADPAAVDAEGVLDLPLGAPIADFPDIPDTGDRLQAHLHSVDSEVFAGLSTYGSTWSFFDGHLEEVTVRATEDDCHALRAGLVARYGAGVEATTPADLNWVGCKVALEYRFSPALLACRATARSVPHYFGRVAWQAGAEQRGVKAGRAAIREHLTRDGDRFAVSASLIAWLEADPARTAVPYTRRRVEASSGVPEGVRLMGVSPDGLLYAVGFRDRDLLQSVNGAPFSDYAPEEGENALTIGYRRSGEDRSVILSFEEGVLPELRRLWGQFP